MHAREAGEGVRARGRRWRAIIASVALLALVACGGGGSSPASGSAAGSSGQALKGVPASAVDAALTGTYWNPFEAGSGMFFEAQGQAGVATFYVFEASGRPVWYSAVGSLTPSTSGYAFAGTLQRYTGGQAATSFTPRTPTATAAGAVTIQFGAGSTARVTLPGRTVDMQRVSLDASRLPAVESYALPAVLPEAGIYWNPAEAGRGYTVEVINGYATVGVFHYDAAGEPVWNLVSLPVGPLGGGVGDFASYRDGQTLAGAYKPSVRSTSNGYFQIKALSNCTSEITLPGMDPVQVHRFSFNPAVEACRGSWLPPATTQPGAPLKSLSDVNISLSSIRLPTVGLFHEMSPAGPPFFERPPGKLRFRISSGELPPGLRLDPDTGTVSGVPLDVRPEFLATVTMTMDGYEGERTMTVAGAAPQVYLKRSRAGSGADHLLNLRLNFEYRDHIRYYVNNGFGGETPLAPGVQTVFSITGKLPAGLSLDADTGTLSGIPTTVQSGNFDLHVDILRGSTKVRQTLGISYMVSQ